MRKFVINLLVILGFITSIISLACMRSEIDVSDSNSGNAISSHQPPSCVDQALAEQFIQECTPLYEPTWANVYEFEFKPHTTMQAQSGCGQPGLACHGQGEQDGQIVWGEGAHTGLGFVGDAAQTHALLLNSQPPFIDPLNLSCSPLVVRMQTEDNNYWMPPGPQTYDSRRRCSMLRWIAQGALPSTN